MMEKDYLKSLPSHRSKRQASEKLCIEMPGKQYTFSSLLNRYLLLFFVQVPESMYFGQI